MSAAAAIIGRTSSAVGVALCLLAAWAPGANGAEVTRVVSALDDDNRFDFHLTASWIHETGSGFVKRESQAPPAAGTEIIKDLKYAQTRDVLNLRADFGILWDVGLRITAPLVLSETSNLRFDQSEGGNCIYVDPTMPNQTPRPNCVDAQNSTILQDGILPTTVDPATGLPTSWGLDAQHSRQFNDSSVFRSPKRSGFQHLGVGLSWAAFNQARDDTKPTWTLSFDALFDVFKTRRFDPVNPGANTGVGLGYHQFVFSTAVSKRFRYFDPYISAWYMLPVRTNGSPFQEYPGNSQSEINPQQRAGLVAGVEQIAWENVQAQQRVTIEARFVAEHVFFGRGHSPIWEPLSGPSTCNSNLSTTCRDGIDLDLDPDPNGHPDRPHPGVTAIEAHTRFGGDLGLNVQVGRYVRFRGLFGLSTDMPHFITAASTGVDRNGDGRVDSTDPAEANPAYRERIDLPGRRFRVEGVKLWTLMLQGSLMF